MSTQETLPSQIHYLGPADSYSGILAEQLYPDDAGVERVPHGSFDDITDAVDSDPESFGLLPIENNSSSTVHENADAIFRGRMIVVGEAILAVRLHAIGLEGADLSSATRAFSHLQALKQCREYMKANGIKGVEMSSTATGAEKVLDLGEAENICLGPEKIAQREGLVVLESNVGDYQENQTRFIQVRKRIDGEEPPLDVNGSEQLKMTMLAELPHATGQLWKYLKEIADEGGNLTTIESRPIPGQPGEVKFWIDLQSASGYIPTIRQTAAKAADKLEVLGVYQPATKVYQS